ncbi:MAG: ABC transporter ATP-binding protein, partial [Chloroflexi bacterium]|nr:ABC transporter ATP-binding protein [Chloroflexota bacterium]
MNHLARTLGYLRRYRTVTVLAYLSLLLMTALNLLVPKLLGWAVDFGIAQGNPGILFRIALLLLVLTLARGVFFFGQNYFSEVASQGVAFDVRNQLYRHWQHLSFSYHDRAQTGQLMTRAMNDVEMLRFFTGRGVLQLVMILVLFVGTAALLFAMNARLALASLAMSPFLTHTALRFSQTIRPLQSQVQQRFAWVTTVVEENLAGMRVVKAFAREPHEIAKFDEANDALFGANVAVFRSRAWSVPLMDTLGNLSTVVVLWYGGTLVIGGELTLGELVAFNTYLALLVMPLRRLGFLIGMLARAAVSAERIFEVLDTRSDVVEKADAYPLPSIRGEVRFEGVSFSYHHSQLVLRDVTFVARPGQVIALLGATGSGKSTIINLIPRFYDVTAGRIAIDGHDIRDVTLRSLRRQIGIVLQETTLFSGTIRENIAYGVPDAPESEIVRVARAARAHDFIASFPGGYETRVGERGVTLSGGQRQRIAIARALLMEPRILILDDATSSVDVETEYLIQQALQTLMRGRTSFVIAQRVSTVRNADLILVLDDGAVIAAGTHAELLHTSREYAEIYELQLISSEVRPTNSPSGLFVPGPSPALRLLQRGPRSGTPAGGEGNGMLRPPLPPPLPP